MKQQLQCKKKETHIKAQDLSAEPRDPGETESRK